MELPKTSHGQAADLLAALKDDGSWAEVDYASKPRSAWRGGMDVSACGRQIFPNSPWSKAGVVRGTMRAMAVADASHARGYLAFIKHNQEPAANDLVGDRYFWRSDYLIHRRAEYKVTLKMSSNCVIGGETVNSEIFPVGIWPRAQSISTATAMNTTTYFRRGTGA